MRTTFPPLIRFWMVFCHIFCLLASPSQILPRSILVPCEATQATFSQRFQDLALLCRVSWTAISVRGIQRKVNSNSRMKTRVVSNIFLINIYVGFNLSNSLLCGTCRITIHVIFENPFPSISTSHKYKVQNKVENFWFTAEVSTKFSMRRGGGGGGGWGNQIWSPNKSSKLSMKRSDYRDGVVRHLVNSWGHIGDLYYHFVQTTVTGWSVFCFLGGLSVNLNHLIA